MAAGDWGLEKLRCSWNQAVLALSPGRSSQPVSPCRASPTKECRSSSRAGRWGDVGRPVLIRVSAGNGDTGECDLPCGSRRAEGFGAVGSVQIGDKGGNEH